MKKSPSAYTPDKGIVVFVYIALGPLFWVLDAYVKSRLFHQGSLLQQLIAPNPIDLFLRTCVFLFTLIYAFVLAKRKKGLTAFTELEEKFKKFLDNLNEAILLADPQGNLLDGNKKAVELFGYSKEEFAGMTYKELQPENQWERSIPAFNEIIRGERKSLSDTLILTKQGTVIPADIYVSTLEYNGHTLLFGIVKDISERKQKEAELHSQAHLIDTILDGVISTDFNLNIKSWNKGAEALYGWKADEVIGKYAPELFKSEFPPQYSRESILKQLAEGIPWQGEVAQTTKDNRKVVVFASTHLYKDILGVPLGFVSVNRDITERKKMDEQMFIERKRFNEYLDFAATFIVVIDPDERVSFINKKGVEILGYPKEEIIGKNWFDVFIPAGIRSALKAVFRQILSGERALFEYNENFVVTKSGAERFIAWHNTILRDQSGKLVSVLSLGNDITENKMMDAILLKEKNFLDAAINSIPGIFYVFDAQGKFLRWNKDFEEKSGYSAKEVAVMSPTDFFNDDEKEHVAQAIGKVFSQGKTTVEANFKAKDGKLTPVYFTGLRAHIDGIDYLVGVGVDISGRKRAEEQLTSAFNLLKQTQAQLIQSSKMAAVGQLSSGVAHEINNPLTGVLNNTQLIKMELSGRKTALEPKELNDLLTVIEESALRCRDIVQALVSFSRPSTGQLQLFSVNELIEKVMILISYEMKLKNVAVERRLQPDLPRIMGDPQALQQVIFNLIQNAKWAIEMKPARAEDAIILSTGWDREHNEVRLQVADTGIGIPKDNIARLFEPFFTTKEVGEGMGMSLAFAYNVVQQHYGAIDVSTAEGKGSTFTIRLPIAPAQQKPHENVGEKR